jgi:hypothetical protein
MNITGKALCLALLTLPVGAMASDEKGCDSVNWGEEVLAKFPNAEKACHGVVMKNDAVYAHYVAEIVASDSESVTVHLIDKHGKGISEVKFVPNPDQGIKLKGKETKWQDLGKGTTLDLWIEHSRWGLYSSPDSTPMKILSRKDL